MVDLSNNNKFILKNKQVKNLHFFVPKNLPRRFRKKIKLLYGYKKVLTPEQKEKKKAKKRKITNLLFFLLNIVILSIVLIVSFAGQDDKSQVLAPTIDWKWIGVLIAIVALTLIVESTKYFILIKTSTKKSRPYLAFKVHTLGKYYDAVTPLSSGGQPFQMMYLNKNGIKGNVATSIPLVKYMVWQIVYVLLCSGILIYNQFFSTVGTQVFSTVMAWIAVAGNLILLLAILLLSVSKKVGPLIVIWILKLGSKLHLIKNYRVTFRKVMRFVVNYQKTMKYFAKNAWVLISEIFLTFIETVLYNIIPYFIYKAFVPGGTLGIVDIMVQSIICNLTLTFIPTPGASGGAEAFFASIFGGIFEGNYFWPLLIWRLSTYYIYLLLGLLVLVYDFLIGNKKAERLRLRELGIESNEPTFRQSLAENREHIKILNEQEEDKLLTPTLLDKDLLNMDKSTENTVEDIIKDGDIVSPDEMKKEVYPAEQVLTTVRIKEIKKHKEKKLKRQIKAQIKSEKKNKNSK